MSLFSLLLGIQYASIALMIFICAWITKKWSKPLHGWLFFYNIAVMGNNAGYLGVMLSHTQTETIMALQFSYLFRIWIPYSIFMFTILLCTKRKLHKTLSLLAVLHVIIYILVLFTKYNTLYYKTIDFTQEGLFPHIIHTNGTAHHIYDALILSYALIGLRLLFRSFRNQKNLHKKKRILFIATAIITDILFYILQLCNVIPGYDITVLGYTIASLFFCIAIFRYDLLETKEIARDIMIDRLSEGIIVTDTEDRIQYLNEPAKLLFPEIKIESDTVPAIIAEAAKQGSHKHITISQKTFAIEKKELIHDEKSYGNLYALIDETEHIALMKEKEQQKIRQIQMKALERQIRMGNETIFAIANAVEARDKNTGKHSWRVSEYSVKIAKELGFTSHQLEQLRKTALLHDIGKIGVPDSILNKPAKLSDEEYEIMKTHTTTGGEILKDFSLIPNVDEGAKFHHERYDGKGYPEGLQGKQIPLNARIIGIADAFDAMTANRIYRKALDLNFVKTELKRCSGSQFDPEMTEILLNLIEEKIINPSETVQKAETSGQTHFNDF